MTPERARQVANGILAVAGVTIAVAVWRQPALRRIVRQLVPVALREIRPVHVAAVMAALAAPPAAVTAAVVAAKASEPERSGESGPGRAGRSESGRGEARTGESRTDESGLAVAPAVARDTAR